MALNEHKLEQLIASIVYIAGDNHVGVYHLNKLVYLFEYFHIKNFGKRFTGEHFIKLPHGPVLSDYKKKFKECHDKKVFTTNINNLMAKNVMDDFDLKKIRIFQTDKTKNFTFSTSFPSYHLLNQIMIKYSRYSVQEIEKIVYSTQPVITYLKKVEQGFKKKTGGPVLKDCIPIKIYNSAVSPVMKMWYNHLSEYPEYDYDQMEKSAREFHFLEQLRPPLPILE